MNRYIKPSVKRTNVAVVLAALCVVLAVSLTGCGLRGGQNNPPPAAPTNPPAAQPTAAPAQPTAEQGQPTAAPAQPTLAPPPTTVVEEADAQGDEIEELLDLLDRQNQEADPLDDVPQ